MILLSILLVFILFFSKLIINLKPIDTYVDGDFVVTNRINAGPIITVDHQNIIVHTKVESNIGDVINIKGHIKAITNHGTFNAIGYFKTHKVTSEIFPSQLHIEEHSLSFFNKTRTYIKAGPSNWRKVAPILLLGIKTKETNAIFLLSKKLSILHLFVISGFHIGIIFKVLSYILKRLKIPYADIFSLLPVIMYVFLLNWTTPALRALLFLMLNSAFNIKETRKTTSLDVIGFVGMILLIVNPFLINSISFQLTLIATTTIIYLNTIPFKSKIIKYLCINIGVFLATLPIIGSMNGWISLWAIFYSITLTPLISMVYIVSILLIPFKTLLSYIYIVMFLILKIFSQTVIIIKTPTFSTTLTYNYYIIFTICILFMEKKVSLSTMRKSELSQNSV